MLYLELFFHLLLSLVIFIHVMYIIIDYFADIFSLFLSDSLFQFLSTTKVYSIVKNIPIVAIIFLHMSFETQTCIFLACIPRDTLELLVGEKALLGFPVHVSIS